MFLIMLFISQPIYDYKHVNSRNLARELRHRDTRIDDIATDSAVYITRMTL
jgi:hypothetical protein